MIFVTVIVVSWKQYPKFALLVQANDLYAKRHRLLSVTAHSNHTVVITQLPQTAIASWLARP